MASAIEDVSSLPGETLMDQEGQKVGEIKEIYAVGENDTPMWVTVELSTGVGRNRQAFVPLARLKREREQIRVPYSYQHIHETPEVEEGDELSEEDDRALRNYYSVGLADEEFIDNPQSYASQVPDEQGPARKVEASAVEGQVREIDDTPSGDLARAAEEAERDEKGDDEYRKGRKATAADVLGGDEGEARGEEDAGEDRSEADGGGARREDDGGEDEGG